MQYLVSLILVSILYIRVSHSEENFNHEYSLIPPFNNLHWYNVGSSHMTDRIVRLTSNVKSQKGIIFNSLPVKFPFWELKLAFRVHGKKTNLFGDGMALWYVDEFNKGSAFGMKEKFKGLGIFLDTYANANGGGRHKFPYITAMINDGSKTYDHNTDGNIDQIDGCTFHFRNFDKEAILNVRYFRETLTVGYQDNQESMEETCFEVNGIHLPSHLKFGLSAETGDLSDYHDVGFLHVNELKDSSMPEFDRSMITPKIDRESFDSNATSKKEVRNGMSFFLKCLLFFLFLLLVVIACVIIIGLYKKREENRLKRFY